MTVSLPVIEFAKEWNVSQEKLYRALVVSNLIAVHQKKYIGSLSAYCGAVSAGCGAGAHYMGQHHRSFQPGEGIVREDVEDTIKSMGYIGRVGMKDTDTEILNIMIDRVDIDEVCK